MLTAQLIGLPQWSLAAFPTFAPTLPTLPVEVGWTINPGNALMALSVTPTASLTPLPFPA